MDHSSTEPILRLRTLTRIGSLWWQRGFPGTVGIYPGRVVISQGSPSQPRCRLVQTSPRVQVVKTPHS